MECASTFVKYHKGLSAFKSAIESARKGLRRVILLIGATGVGKTHHVMEAFPEAYNVFDIRSPWFDGYTGQEAAIFDECGEGMMGFNELKKLTDRYAMQVPIKGGSVNWQAKFIYLTSNKCMDEWYPKASSTDMAALHRRIKTFCLPHELEDLKRYEAQWTGEDEPVLRRAPDTPRVPDPVCFGAWSESDGGDVLDGIWPDIEIVQ